MKLAIGRHVTIECDLSYYDQCTGVVVDRTDVVGMERWRVKLDERKNSDSGMVWCDTRHLRGQTLRERWSALLARHQDDSWVEPTRPAGFTFWWTRPWMFTLARRLHGGFRIGCVHSMPGEHWALLALYGPRIQHFSKRPGQAWCPERWGGAALGLEIGQR